MSVISTIFLHSTLLFLAGIDVSVSDIVAGYVPGISGMPKVDKSNCLNDQILSDPSLSDPLECARTCYKGEPPRTCYYHFTIERYPVNGQACQYCTPNFTNTMCADCQCIVGNGVPRMALSVNRMIPGPSIQACKGDRIVVDVANNIAGEAITIHWHGVFQQGTQYYDGVPYVTQCPIQFQTTFRYNFYANNSGTFFWHAHTGLHKMDGVFGALVVRKPEEDEPHASLYDFDLANHVIVINDWMNEESTERAPGRNSGVTGQVPDAVMINGKGQLNINNVTPSSKDITVFTVDPGARYRFRVINSFCGVCPGELSIQGHNLTVIATDGEPIEPVVVNSIVSLAGERYDFVINTDQAPSLYWIQLRALGNCKNQEIQSLAILQYSGVDVATLSASPGYKRIFTGVTLNSIKDGCSVLDPYELCISALHHAIEIDPAILKPDPDLKFYLPIGLFAYSPEDLYKPNTYSNFLVPAPNSSIASSVGGIFYMSPSSPPISQLEDLPENQFCNSDELPTGCHGGCKCTHMLRIPLNAVVEIIIIDSFQAPLLNHPFHLHGYKFHVVAMGQPLGPNNNSSGLMTVEYLKELDRNNGISRNLVDPPGKDTIAIPNNGYAIFRFHATNPGYWFLHCHFAFHQLAGMQLIVKVGENSDLPPVPENFPKCGNFQPPIY